MDTARLQRRLSPLLRPVSRGYAAALRMRAARYAREGAAYRSPIPVVSVGNIAWGGTGKTPLVGWLLGWAEEHHRRFAVLSRGYKARPEKLPLPVSPGLDPEQAGDEPLLLARAYPQSLVIVDPQRSRAARWAETSLEPDLFILDDGMQHLAMARDVDIVLLRKMDLDREWDRVIPAGSWREDASALERADVFCIKCAPEVFASLESRIDQRLGGYGKPVFSFTLKGTGLLPLDLQRAAPLQPDLGGEPYVLFNGVGEPSQVRVTASALLGREPREQIVFPDHHLFRPEDAESLAKRGLPLVCTAKDAVKLFPLAAHFGDIPVFSLQTELVFGPGRFTMEEFPAWWQNTWALLRNKPHRQAAPSLADGPKESHDHQPKNTQEPCRTGKS